MKCYLVVQPPSIVRVDPVTCLASSLQRYNTIEPTWTMRERERERSSSLSQYVCLYLHRPVAPVVPVK